MLSENVCFAIQFMYSRKHTCAAIAGQRMQMNSNLWKAASVGALGGLLFGFDTAVIAGTIHSLTILYQLTPWTVGVTVFTALFGTVIGAMCAGVVGQRLGSRETLRILAVFYLISAIGCALQAARAIGLPSSSARGDKSSPCSPHAGQGRSRSIF